MKTHLYIFLLWQFTLGLLVAIGCNVTSRSTSTPIASIPAMAFLLEANVFPDSWKASLCDTRLCRDGDGGNTAAERDFYLPNASGHAFQEVYRFSDERVAGDKFKVYKDANFNESRIHQPFVPFTPPPEITFESQIADESYFACGVDVVPQCKMLARYRNYFVYFYFDHVTEDEPGGLTYTEIEQILKALDDKVIALLNNFATTVADTTVQPCHEKFC